jgi:ferredoxin-NADP reductase
VIKDSKDISSITLNGPSIGQLRATPGQYFLLRPLAKGLWWQAHPFSLSAAQPLPDCVSHKRLGDDTRQILRIRPGTRVLPKGPYGAFTADRAAGMPVALIACAVGIAPIRSILENCSPGQSPIAIVRVHDDVEFVHREEIEDLVKGKGGSLHLLSGPRAIFATANPFGSENLTACIPDVRRRHAFVYGPATLELAVCKGLRAAGMKRSHAHFERFDV